MHKNYTGEFEFLVVWTVSDKSEDKSNQVSLSQTFSSDAHSLLFLTDTFEHLSALKKSVSLKVWRRMWSLNDIIRQWIWVLKEFVGADRIWIDTEIGQMSLKTCIQTNVKDTVVRFYFDQVIIFIIFYPQV